MKAARTGRPARSSRRRAAALILAIALVPGAAFCAPAAGPAPASLLDEIIAEGVLRVGTTGDYAPFSMSMGADEDAYAGYDIDMARALAASLDARLVFVRTSWPTLMEDLLQGRFHIAMSGVSRTLARARLAAFSRPYHRGGKRAIVRCADAERFRSLTDIDQADTRVVVNPGGTNERVTRALLRHAPIRIHPDNTTVFREIAEGRADLMITDAIEVAVQTRHDPALCAAVPDVLFERVEKAYLLPRDEPWIRYVDLWLEEIPAAERARLLGEHVARAAADL